MGVLLFAVMVSGQPPDGKLHEAMLRAGIVGVWRLHAFDNTLTDPEYASVFMYRSNGRYIWSHQTKRKPRMLRAGRYEIVGNLLKKFGNPGTEIPHGTRVVSMPTCDILRIDFSNGRERSWNILFRVKPPVQVTCKGYGSDQPAQAMGHLGFSE